MYTPKFGVVKYSYIQTIVLSFVEQFPTIRHVSEDRKMFEVGEIFYLSLGKLEDHIHLQHAASGSRFLKTIPVLQTNEQSINKFLSLNGYMDLRFVYSVL